MKVISCNNISVPLEILLSYFVVICVIIDELMITCVNAMISDLHVLSFDIFICTGVLEKNMKILMSRNLNVSSNQ